eukprot:TRINITY_DN1734_c0_g1_i2.p1 TRINITY_DN1734_c0_g1~~TRINITY_DN1734_c0_g1_i2.p1  ORF type:complete len:788 (+),score=172.90 TRINITY_DN1734_c0_g1_i2:287-2365(+)
MKGALTYFRALPGKEFNEEEFNKAAGVGVKTSVEDIDAAVEGLFTEKEAEIKEDGYSLESTLLNALKAKLPWAPVRDVKQRLDAKLLAVCGPKGDKKAKKAAPAKKAAAPAKKAAPPKGEAGETSGTDAIKLADSVKFPKPEENTQLRPELLAAHLAATGGRIVTRFPPEPNGYLHIGHAKAMNLNFGYAKKHGGWCYLRFDDTNPEAESQEYIDSIMASAAWLGHKPYMITHASDRFEDLYRLAVELIKRGKAYVCFDSADKMKADRQHRKETGETVLSKDRDQPIEETLRLFEDMKNGKFAEGEVTLRMKQDMYSNNPCMWDHVAYRIKYTPHPHVGDKWCIYPSYDFTHCLCDSMENITHSLCSLEFEIRRESYNWLCESLGIYRPPQIEYSRLNLKYTVLSKRKLIQLVKGGYVKGWDDPRIPTIDGFRRRGYTPEAINSFCEAIGVTRSSNFQEMSLLEEFVRQDLDDKVDREMAVFRPLRVELTNYPEDKVEAITVANHPREDLNRGTHTVPFSRVLYIDRNDFRPVDSANYFRLAPGKEVRLKYAYNIKCTEVVNDDKGEPVLIKATVDVESKKLPKGIINWVAQPAPGVDPLTIEVRLYDRLFKSPFPEGTKAKPQNYLDDINPSSCVIIQNAFANPTVKGLKPLARVQFEREAYFVVDLDSTDEKLVFNRIVSLKEDKLKNTA